MHFHQDVEKFCATVDPCDAWQTVTASEANYPHGGPSASEVEPQGEHLDQLQPKVDSVEEAEPGPGTEHLTAQKSEHYTIKHQRKTLGKCAAANEIKGPFLCGYND